MTEFRFLNGNDATRYTAIAANRLLAANLASVVAAGEVPDLTAVIRRQIAALVAQHRDLDSRIARLIGTADDELNLRRLKKQKLHLKDQIAQLETRLVPDVPA